MLQFSRQYTLRPTDIVIALQVAQSKQPLLKDLSRLTATSLGEVHGSLRRLADASLLAPGERRIVTDVLVPFLVHGVPHAFPAILGPEASGIPTAYVPAVSTGLQEPVVNAEYVWPSVDGTAHGHSLIPLHPRAATLASTNTPLAELLVLLDLLRIGGAAERAAAEAAIRARLQPVAP